MWNLYRHVTPDACRVQRLTLGVVPPEPATECLTGTRSFWIWTGCPGCPAIPIDPPVSASAGITRAHHYTWLFIWILRSNTGPHVWQALYWHLSPWPGILSFWPNVSTHAWEVSPRSTEPLLPPARPLFRSTKLTSYVLRVSCPTP